MNERNRNKSAVASSEAAELHGDLFSVVIHELGAISTALTLRAEALATVLPAADQTALLALSSEIADIKRSLRIVQGPRGSLSALSPERRMPASEWWRVISRMVAAALPRGVTVRLHPSSALLTPKQANGLMLTWLAACKEATEGGLASPNAITLTMEPRPEDGLGVVMTAEFDATTVLSSEQTHRGQRWFRYATRVARASGAQLAWWVTANGVTRWQCTIS